MNKRKLSEQQTENLEHTKASETKKPRTDVFPVTPLMMMQMKKLVAKLSPKTEISQFLANLKNSISSEIDFVKRRKEFYNKQKDIQIMFEHPLNTLNTFNFSFCVKTMFDKYKQDDPDKVLFDSCCHYILTKYGIPLSLEDLNDFLKLNNNLGIYKRFAFAFVSPEILTERAEEINNYLEKHEEEANYWKNIEDIYIVENGTIIIL